MKLTIECVRDVLLEIEDLPWGRNTPSDLKTSIKKHGQEPVMYTLAKLDEAQYINCQKAFVPSTGRVRVDIVYSMTFGGHEFLNSIREEGVWNRLKGAMVDGGAECFEVIKDIGIELLKAALIKKLGVG